MWTRRNVLIGAVAAVGAVGPSARAGTVGLLNVSYDPTRELYTEINEQFAAFWMSKTGNDVTIEQSHGGSSKQARSVIDGLRADVVTLALGWDITAIEQAGLIKPDWQQRLPFNASPYTSTVAFLVRKGNPKGIKDWSDLIRPGIEVVTANPKTGGGGRWSFLAFWGAVATAPTHDLSTAVGLAEAASAAADAREFPAYDSVPAEHALTQFYNEHIPVLDTGARGSTVSFAQKQIGDVLLNWENELWLAMDEFGADKFDIVYPPVSILGEPPVAVVDSVVDAKGTREVAEAFLRYLYSEAAQETMAQLHYRPRSVEVLRKYSGDLPRLPLFTIDEVFGGWPRAQKTFFADGGVFDTIYRPAK